MPESCSKQGPSGRVENLTSEQELVLKKIWANYLLHWGYKIDAKHILEPYTNDESANNSDDSNNGGGGGGVLKVLGFGKKKSNNNNTNTNVSSRSSESVEAVYPHSYINESLKKLDPSELKEGFWKFLRSDYPDNLILRFIRARKWDMDKSLGMMGASIHWRLKEDHPDQLIMQGEKNALYQSVKENKNGLWENIRLRKAVMRGRDILGRPVVIVRPRLHHSSQQNEKEMEEYALIIIEETRLYLAEPNVDQATILFDMSGFGTSNMDYAPVKFLIKCFEAHYPECLGRLIIHKAPWLFSPIWNIVKNWLDPVVASKVVFTKNLKDLEKFINVDNIPIHLGGNDDYDFENMVVDDLDEWESHDKCLKDTETRDKIMVERNEIISKFIDVTAKWVEAKDSQENEKYMNEKIELSRKLSANYIKLDPYIRSRSQYDIEGTLVLS